MNFFKKTDKQQPSGVNISQLNKWHEEGEDKKIIQAIEALSPSETTFELRSMLACAYNNTSEYETALNILLADKVQGKDDAMWNYRTGYTYLHKEEPDLETALAYLERSKELGCEYADELIDICKAYMSGETPQTSESDFSDEEWNLDYEQKEKGLEYVLGKMHNLVGHAIIPFSIGGAVDMYYFPNHIKGTGFATMELLAPDGTGPLPNRLGTYELVAFTKYDIENVEYDVLPAKTETSPFNKIERKICGVFTTIGNYSFEAELNPLETCEIPMDNGEENICMAFDLYQPDGKKFMIGEREHHLLLCILLFRSEMEYAREHGSQLLFDKLKQAGHYPYSDLDREHVV